MKDAGQLNFAEGEVLLFDKPKGWTSFDLVKKVRNLVRVKKVGHAGTLDPLATGLLILCTGKKTKTIDHIQAQEKEYVVEFQLGATTPSYDSEFPPENETDFQHIDREQIEKALVGFRGEIQQVPPQFSAVKVDGKRAYKAARAGQKIEIKSRQVTVYAYDLDSYEATGRGIATIRCSKGTYIRTLVHDLGQNLGVGAYIVELKRTRIGDFSLANAWEIDDFAAQVTAAREAKNTSE